MLQNDWQLAQQSLLGETTCFFVNAVVGFDSESPVCLLAKERWAEILAEVNESLGETFGGESVSVSSASQWLAQQCTQEAQHVRWTAIQNQNYTPLLARQSDGLDLPQCTLLLSSRWLIEDERRVQLLEEIRAFRTEFSTFVLLFLDCDGGNPVSSVQREKIEQLTRDFICLAPARTCLYLTGSSFNNGRPIAPEELAEACAIALCTDSFLSSRASARLLAYDPSMPIVTFSTFGLRALRYYPSRFSRRLALRLSQDLLGQTVFAEPDASLPPSLPVPEHPQAVISQAFANASGVKAKPLLNTECDSENTRHWPCMVGSGFRFSVDLGGLGVKIDLRDQPKRTWKNEVYKWDFILRKSRVPRWLEQLAEKVDAITSENRTRIAEELTAVFAQRGGEQASALAIQNIADWASENLTFHTEKRKTISLDQSLKKLDAAFSAIPHGPSLYARVAILLCLQGTAAWMLWPPGDSTLRRVLFAGTALLAFITAISAPLWRMRNFSRSDKVLGQVLDDIENRRRYEFCELFQNKFAEVKSYIEKQLGIYREIFAGICQELRRMNEVPPADPSAALSFIHYLPAVERTDDFYEYLVASDLDSRRHSSLRDRFLELLKADVLKAMKQEITAANIARNVQTFTEGEIGQKVHGIELWRFFCQDLSLNSGNQPQVEIARRIIEPLLHEKESRVFLRGPAVEESLLINAESIFVAPEILKDSNPFPDGEFVHTAARNLLSLVTRTELARVSED